MLLLKQLVVFNIIKRFGVIYETKIFVFIRIPRVLDELLQAEEQFS